MKVQNDVSDMKLKKKLSKNRKKGWRKNVQVEDVNEFLEDVRLQQRTGGLVAEKKDEDLFFMHKTSSDDVVLGNKTKKRTKQNLKCYNSLENHSKVVVPIKPNVTKAVVKNKKTKQVVKKKAQVPQEADNDSNYDLWAESKTDDKVDDQEIVVHFKRSTRKQAIKVPCHRYQKTSLLDAVETPHAGASYNPTYESHQQLLADAHNDEVNKLKTEQKLKRALDDKFPSKKDAPNQETWLTEMSQGLVDDSSEEDGSDGDLALIHKNPPVRGDMRKVKSKRKKEREIKLKKINKQSQKKKTKEENEVFRLKSIKREIEKDEARSAMLSHKNMIKKSDKMYNPTRKGQYRYQKPDLEIKLTDELVGSLRQAQPEGTLLEDRFKSFQRRNILPVTIQQKKLKRKYKLKRYTKRTHRDVQT